MRSREREAVTVFSPKVMEYGSFFKSASEPRVIVPEELLIFTLSIETGFPSLSCTVKSDLLAEVALKIFRVTVFASLLVTSALCKPEHSAALL